MSKRSLSAASVMTIAVILLAGCSALPTTLARPDAAPTTVVVPAPTAVKPVPQTGAVDGGLAAYESTIETIYQKVNPAVVNIHVIQKQKVTSPNLPNIPFFFGQPDQQAPQERIIEGSGSGFVWDTKGDIVTNNHVVDGADKIEVTFYDGTTVPAKLVGADPDSDLAVIHVEGVATENLQPVDMADSDTVTVGQLAVAIGNPFGLQGTMTLGIVSAVGRSLPAGSEDLTGPSYTIPDVIQTDAPINPGNSGGVLVDDGGRVIGVTAAIASPVRASSGVGFAIPSTIVRQVVPSLIESGHYVHPYIGVSGTSLTPDLAEAMDLDPQQRGALIVDVVPRGPADKAGLHGSDRQITIDGQAALVGGDVIVAIESQPVKAFDDLVAYLVRYTQVGQNVQLTVLRDGKETPVTLTLEARPDHTSTSS